MLETSECGRRSQRFNRERLAATLQRQAMREALLGQRDGAALCQMLLEERPHLFADSPVYVTETCVGRLHKVIAAIGSVTRLAAFQLQALAHAPPNAVYRPNTHGVFFGYDFHLSPSGPRLIEINTNAGGAMLNALLLNAQSSVGNGDGQAIGHSADKRLNASAVPVSELGALFFAMFEAEWRSQRGSKPLHRIAIVDEAPTGQFLYPEFLLFRNLFERHGVAAVVCGPDELSFAHGALWHDGRRVDLVYNRLTDFGLQEPAQQALAEAYLAGAAVVTPHPNAHALYADKRNLTLLSDAEFLQQCGVDAVTQKVLLDGVAHTEIVRSDAAERLWAERKRLFFKPAAGFGGKAAYRGDKLTRRVFEEILLGDYVAQELVQPSQRRVSLDGVEVDLKLDLRAYVYQDKVQLLTTRLYQGQTTNFRTPGGGFAPVRILPCNGAD